MRDSAICTLKITNHVNDNHLVAEATSEQGWPAESGNDIGDRLAQVMADALLRLDTSAPVIILAKAALMLREMRKAHSEEVIPQTEEFFRASLKLAKAWKEVQDPSSN